MVGVDTKGVVVLGEIRVVVHGYAVAVVEELEVDMHGVVIFGFAGGSVTVNIGRYTRGFPLRAQEESI